MSIVLQSSGGGSVTINEPTTASNFTQTLPAGTGTVAVQGASTNIVSGTAVASTSGTSITFTGIPSWVKRITVMLNGVSTSGTSNLVVQVGAGSVATSGYTSMVQSGGSAIVSSSFFVITYAVTASYVYSGTVPILNLGSNTWVSSSVIAANNVIGVVSSAGGNITLGGTLDRVVITTANGTDTFDAGSINILYE
jgi:hypothetical protein